MNVHMVFLDSTLYLTPKKTRNFWREACLISGENSEITIKDNDAILANMVRRW